MGWLQDQGLLVRIGRELVDAEWCESQGLAEAVRTVPQHVTCLLSALEIGNRVERETRYYITALVRLAV